MGGEGGALDPAVRPLTALGHWGSSVVSGWGEGRASPQRTSGTVLGSCALPPIVLSETRQLSESPSPAGGGAAAGAEDSEPDHCPVLVPVPMEEHWACPGAPSREPGTWAGPERGCSLHGFLGMCLAEGKPGSELQAEEQAGRRTRFWKSPGYLWEKMETRLGGP